MNQIRVLSLAIIAALALVACDDDAADQSTIESAQSSPNAVQTAVSRTVSAASASPLLAYVPSDTPYFAINPQPMPEQMVDLMWKQLDGAMGGMSKMMELAAEETEDAASGKDGPIAVAWREMFAGKLNRDGFTELGLVPGDYYAFYGLGVLPVARLSLQAEDKFDQTVAQFLAKAELDIGQQQLGAYNYYLFGEKLAEHLDADTEIEIEGESIKINDDARLLVATGDDQLVVSFVPSDATEDFLRQVIGVDKPAKALPVSAINEINRTYDFGPHGTAMLSTTQIAEQVLTVDNPMSNEWFAEIRSELSEVCKNEVLEMTAIAPRMVAGYGELSEQRMESLAVLDIRRDLAEAAAAISLDIPAAARDDLFALSMGFDLIKAKQFVLDRVNAIEADPFKCENFAELNDTAQIKQGLSQPIPPFVSTIRGVNLSFSSIEFGPNGEPIDGKGLAMLMMDNPQLLLGMGQMFVPELAELDVPADGSPVELPLASLAVAGVPPLHMSMTDAGIGLAVGEDQAQRLSAFVDSDNAAEGTVLSFAYDVKAFTELQMAGLRKELATSDEKQSKILLEMLDQVEQSMAFLDRVTGDVMLTSRGIEISSVTELAQ